MGLAKTFIGARRRMPLIRGERCYFASVHIHRTICNGEIWHKRSVLKWFCLSCCDDPKETEIYHNRGFSFCRMGFFGVRFFIILFILFSGFYLNYFYLSRNYHV